MKLAFATPDEMGFFRGLSQRFPGWVVFPTDFLRPSEIRARIHALIDEEDADDTCATEHMLVTMNRTVYDLVTYPELNCPGPMDYADVYVWRDGELLELLDLYQEEWLSHFALGDVLDREM